MSDRLPRRGPLPILDIVIIHKHDDGVRFPAIVTNVTKGGRRECVWEKRGRRDEGLTKPALIDPTRMTIEGSASQAQADRLRELAAKESTP